MYTNSIAPGGGGSFKSREPIGELGSFESPMAGHRQCSDASKMSEVIAKTYVGDQVICILQAFQDVPSNLPPMKPFGSSFSVMLVRVVPC